MKRKIIYAKYFVYILLFICALVLLYDYLDKKASDFMMERTNVLRKKEGIDKYVSPLSINVFVSNLQNEDDKTLNALLIEENNRYIFNTYYNLVIVPKTFNNIEQDVVLEVRFAYENNINIDALLKALKTNMNDSDRQAVVKHIQKQKEYNYTGKGIKINKSEDYLSIIRNITY